MVGAPPGAAARLLVIPNYIVEVNRQNSQCQQLKSEDGNYHPSD
jgi:hypothetical protein